MFSERQRGTVDAGGKTQQADISTYRDPSPKTRVIPTRAVSMCDGLVLGRDNRGSVLYTSQPNPITLIVFRTCPSRVNEEPDQEIGKDA